MLVRSSIVIDNNSMSYTIVVTIISREDRSYSVDNMKIDRWYNFFN